MSEHARATICTIVGKNYLAHARALVDSFFEHHPDGQAFVLLVDRPDGYFDPSDEQFTTVLVEHLDIPFFSQMAFRYDMTELATAVKPFFLDHLLATRGCQSVCYLDPDIIIYGRLDALFELLESSLMVLLPHLLDTLDDGHQPDEPYILRAGTYNLGFIGVSQHQELDRFLGWWQRRLATACVVDPANGFFVDQRWMDLAPGLFDGVTIHRDPGCDVAYWNLNHRRLTHDRAGYRVNGSPLTFFHFSGFDPTNLTPISRHQDRYTVDEVPLLRPLCEDYRDRLLRHGFVQASSWPNAYNAFAGGVRIPDLSRRLWRESHDRQARWPNPVEGTGPDSFMAWLNAAADGFAGSGPLITNLSAAFHRARPDLQRAFPEPRGDDRLGFACWFAAQGAVVDPYFTEPVRDSVADAGSRSVDNRFRRWVFRQYRDDTVVHRLYCRLQRFFERIGAHAYFDRIVVGQLASANPTAPAATSHRASGLNIVGYLGADTGVGEVARSVAGALAHHEYPVSLTAIDMAGDKPNVTGHGARNPHPANLLHVNADQVPAVSALLGPGFFADRLNIGFWFWELSRFPEAFRESFGRFDEIWVASQFIQAAVASVSPVPVVTMPIPVRSPVTPTRTRGELGLPPDRLIFLSSFDGRSYVERKNPFAVVRAFRMAFGPSSTQATLLMKSHGLPPATAERLRREVEGVSGVLVDRTLNRDDTDALFHACDAYVSLHRSEGFGLPLAEAMTIGKPAVATGYSGNMDFMTDENSYPIPYRMVQLSEDHGPYRAGEEWAEPDIEQAAAVMQRIADSPEEAAETGALAQRELRRRYNATAVRDAIRTRLATTRDVAI